MDKLLSLLKEKESILMDKNIMLTVGVKEAFLFGHMQNLHEKNIPIISLELLKIIPELSHDKTLHRLLNKLEKAGFIIKHELSHEEKRNILLLKRGYKDYGIGINRCQWCYCKTLILHSHHYPIRKKDGGIKTVDICPNCHYEFHSMKYEYKIKTLSENKA